MTTAEGGTDSVSAQAAGGSCLPRTGGVVYVGPDSQESTVP